MATKRGQKAGGGAVASNGKAPAPSPANAWARPLKTSGPPPGMGPADKARAPPTSGNKPATSTSAESMNNNNNKATPTNGAPTVASIHRERLLHLSLTLIGQKVVATLTDGTVLEGVFHTFTPFDGLEADVKNKYVLNTVKVVKAGKDSSIKSGSTVILAVEKVAQMYAKNINLDRPNKAFGGGGKNEFETDTQISGTRGAGTRELVSAGNAWTSAPTTATTAAAVGGKQTRAEALAGALGATSTSTGAKDTSGLKGNIGGWDQFKANSELFNVNATFDENLYTTELDKSQIDSRKIAEAERIAREIETTTSSNIHIAEERGQAVETDYDEEDRYSGVLTKEGKQRHESQPQQPSKPTAAGAPKKVMNYAAAAAKADATRKAASQPAIAGKAPAAEAKPSDATTAKVIPEEKKTAAPAPAPKEEVKKEESKDADSSKEAAPAPKPAEETKDESKSEEKKPEEKSDAKPKSSKLNANAKEFTFNPAAKSFTPSFGGGMGGGASFGAPQQPPQQQMPDPNMHVHPGGHPMQPPHYMHAQMGQPGMMPMMSPQYPGMRYPPQYAGMDQQGVPHMQGQQPQHVQATPGAAQLPATAPPSQGGLAAPPTGDASTGSAGPSAQEGESSQPSAPGQPGPQSQQQQQQPPQQQQQPMPMHYNVPPQGAYFAGGAMGMHPRGPGGYPPQFVGGPQQIPVGPQGAPYGRQMYPMQPGGMPPNMHMRGPGGAPYYAGPNGPMPYPPGAYGHGMMDDGDGGFRGRGGRGQGRGRGGRGRRGGGRGPGRGHYQNNQHHQQQQYGGGPNSSGRSTPQQQGAPDQGATNAPPQGPPHEGEKPNEGGKPEASP